MISGSIETPCPTIPKGVRSGSLLLSSDPLLNFRRKSQGGGSTCPKFPQGGGWLAYFWARRLAIGAEGAIFEKFGQNFEKSGLKCNKNQFC